MTCPSPWRSAQTALIVNYLENLSLKKISKKALSGGILANPRPLYNSNVAKVSIVKWSKNWMFVDGNPFLAYPMILN